MGGEERGVGQEGWEMWCIVYCGGMSKVERRGLKEREPEALDDLLCILFGLLQSPVLTTQVPFGSDDGRIVACLR